MGFPTPPLDGASGRLIIRIRKPGVLGFHVGVHIPEFATAPSATAAVDGTTTDWGYPGTLPGVGDEPTVAQTAIDLIDAIKPLYDSGFEFNVTGLYRLVPSTAPGYATKVAQQVFPVPAIATINGINGDDALAADSPSKLVTSYYMGRSGGNAADTHNPYSGRRFVLKLRGIPGRAAGWILTVSPTSGGYNQAYAVGILGTYTVDQHVADRALAGYLSQQTAINGHKSVILAHDGTVPTPQFDLVTNTTKRAIRGVRRDQT